MKNVESKILKAISTNKFNPQKLGERSWHSYFIRVTELVWSRNLYDGYQIEVYDKENRRHLTTLII